MLEGSGNVRGGKGNVGWEKNVGGWMKVPGVGNEDRNNGLKMKVSVK